MAFTRYYPSGTADGVILPAAWVNYIDSKLPNIIDADAGGTWANSALIRLTGAVQLAALTIASGDTLTAASGSTLLAGLTCDYGADQFHGDGTYWTEYGGVGWYHTDTSNVGVVERTISLPIGTRITNMAMWIDGNGAGSSHSGMPATKPAMIIERSQLVNGAASYAGYSSVDSITDPETDYNEYDKLHEVSKAVSIDIASGYRYRIRVTGEGSTNAVNGALAFYCVFLTIDRIAVP